MNSKYWIIPNKFYQVDDKAGGDPGKIKDPPETEEVELEPKAKLFELELDYIDQLFDRDDVDAQKLLDWMKTRDEETTLDAILIKEKEDAKAAADGKVAADDTDDDKGKKDPDAEKEITDDESDLTKAEDKKSDDKKVEEPDKSKIEDDAGTEDKTKVKTIKISEEYINKQVQNFRDQWKDENPDAANKKIEAITDILNGVKGGEMDPRALKNYVNAQLYIKTIKSPFDADWKPDQIDVTNPEYIEKATKQKQEMIVNKIKTKYPDFPEDALKDDDSLKEFEDSLSRRQFQEYSSFYDEVTKSIDSEYDRYVHVTQNWETIAEQTIKTDVSLFQSRLAKLNLTLKDIGIDSLDLNEKDLYNEYLWKNVLFVGGETSKPREDVLVFMDNVIPVIKPKSVYNLLMDLNMDSIVKAREHKARQQGFNAGLNNIEDPSTSLLPGKEHRQKVEIDAEDFDDDNLTPQQMQDKLDRLKNTIAASSGAVVKKRK